MNQNKRFPMKDARLRSSYELARKASDEVRKKPKSRHARYDPLVRDLSTMVIEVIHCIETNSVVSENCFSRVTKYVANYTPSPLLQVVQSIEILLGKLMRDRFEGILQGPHHIDSVRDQTTHQHSHDIKDEPVDPDEEMAIYHPIGDASNSTTMKIEDYRSCLINDGHDVKKEESMVDMYLPMTGESRPLEINLDSTEDSIVKTEDEQTASTSSDVMDKVLIDPSNGTEVRQTASKLPITHNFTTSSCPPRKCYLCGGTTEQYAQTPKNEPEREQFLNRIDAQTDQEIVRVYEIKQSSYRANFCTRHFMEGHVVKDTSEVVHEAKVIIDHFKSTRRPVKPATVLPDNVYVEQRKCFICGMHAIDFYTLPGDTRERAAFLNAITLRVARHRSQLEAAEPGISVSFCANHTAETRRKVVLKRGNITGKIIPVSQRVISKETVPSASLRLPTHFKSPFPTAPTPREPTL